MNVPLAFQQISHINKGIQTLGRSHISGITDDKFIVNPVPATEVVILWKRRQIIGIDKIRDNVYFTGRNPFSQ